MSPRKRTSPWRPSSARATEIFILEVSRPTKTVSDIMAEIGRRARAAARRLGRASDAERTLEMEAMAARIRARSAGILAANADDVAEA